MLRATFRADFTRRAAVGAVVDRAYRVAARAGGDRRPRLPKPGRETRVFKALRQVFREDFTRRAAVGAVADRAYRVADRAGVDRR